MYAATKAAALSLVTSLHVELKKDKIRVHAICPDGVDTQMVQDMETGGRAQSLVASGTFFQPEQVARELVSMFGTRRVYRTMPVYRGIQQRISAFAPGPTMRFEPILERIGRRKIKQGRFTS